MHSCHKYFVKNFNILCFIVSLFDIESVKWFCNKRQVNKDGLKIKMYTLNLAGVLNKWGLPR